MAKRDLSPREEEIVQLCVEGLTNDAIAHKLDISVGTVNTYWLRIRLKVGGSGRTDTVVRIIKDRAEKALRDANVERSSLIEMVAEREHHVLELRAALALFNLAMEQIKSTVWAADMDLVINILANGEYPSTHFGVKWEVGKSIFEIFKTIMHDYLNTILLYIYCIYLMLVKMNFVDLDYPKRKLLDLFCHIYQI